MKYKIERDETLRTNTVTLSWTDGEVGDLVFTPAERELLDQQVYSAKCAAMVVLIVAAGIEEAAARDQRQFH